MLKNNQKQATSNQKPETRNQKPVTSNQIRQFTIYKLLK